MAIYHHVVKYDAGTRILRVFRTYPDGSAILFTEYDLTTSAASGWTDDVVALAQKLGEDLLLDSPSARDLLGL